MDENMNTNEIVTTGFDTEEGSDETETSIGYMIAIGGAILGGICLVGKKIFGKKKKYAEVDRVRLVKEK